MNLISFANFTQSDNQNAFLPPAEKDGKTEDFSAILNSIFVALQTANLPATSFSDGFEQVQTISESGQNFVIGNNQFLPENAFSQSPVLLANIGKDVPLTNISSQINLPTIPNLEEISQTPEFNTEVPIPLPPLESLISIPTNFQPEPKLPMMQISPAENSVSEKSPEMPQNIVPNDKTLRVEPIINSKDFEILSVANQNSVLQMQNPGEFLSLKSEQNVNFSQVFRNVRDSIRENDLPKEIILKPENELPQEIILKPENELPQEIPSKTVLPESDFAATEINVRENQMTNLPPLRTEKTAEIVKTSIKETVTESQMPLSKPPVIQSVLPNSEIKLPLSWDLKPKAEPVLPSQQSVEVKETLHLTNTLAKSPTIAPAEPESNAGVNSETRQMLEPIVNVDLQPKTDLVSKLQTTSILEKIPEVDTDSILEKIPEVDTNSILEKIPEVDTNSKVILETTAKSEFPIKQPETKFNFPVNQTQIKSDFLANQTEIKSDFPVNQTQIKSDFPVNQTETKSDFPANQIKERLVSSLTNTDFTVEFTQDSLNQTKSQIEPPLPNSQSAETVAETQTEPVFVKEIFSPISEVSRTDTISEISQPNFVAEIVKPVLPDDKLAATFNSPIEDSFQPPSAEKNPIPPALANNQLTEVILPPAQTLNNKSNDLNLADDEIFALLDNFAENTNVSATDKPKSANYFNVSEDTAKISELPANQLPNVSTNNEVKIENIELNFNPKTEKETKPDESENNLSITFGKIIEKSVNESKPIVTSVKNQFEPVEIAEQINPHLLGLAALVEKNNEKEILKLRLHPAELGMVDITLERDSSGVLNAHFKTETADAQQALSKGLEQLRDNLQNAGWEVGNLELSNSSSSTTDNQPRQHNQTKPELTENFVFSQKPEQTDETESNSPARLLNLSA